jgi:threonine dehydratase
VIALEEIRAARERIAGAAVRTPLVRLPLPGPGPEIHLKLETLQPVNSFKIRGAVNAVRAAPPEQLAQGLVTSSAGNMAQGVAWIARELGVPATIVVPEGAPRTKIAAVERMGGRVVPVPYDDWWRTLEERRAEGVPGFFVHPVEDEGVMAGNGTIGLEIHEDLPDADAVVVPFGGGGLAVGVASAMRAVAPGTRVYAAEPETGAALVAALAAGHPAPADFARSWIDGAGSRMLLPGMWSRLADLLDGAVAVPLADAAGAVRLLAERVRVIAEGAGGLALAAALSGRAGEGKIVCVVSGGNIDLATLTRILAEDEPTGGDRT